MITAAARTASNFGGFQERDLPASYHGRPAAKFLLMPFLIGLVAAQKIIFVGEIYLGEILAAIYLVCVITQYRFDKTERTLSILALCWCGAQIASDFNNHTELSSALKGEVAPLLFISTLMALTIFFKRQTERIPAFLVGAAIGEIINHLLFPKFFPSMSNDFFSENMWKWGLGGTVLIIFAVWHSFYSKRRSRQTLLLFLALLVIPSLYFQARGLAILPLLSAVFYIFLRTGIGAKMRKDMIRGVGILKFGLPALVLLGAINEATSYLFSSEALLKYFKPEDAEKYRIQATGRYGVLLGGRSELLVSVSAFLDKPFLGHGSWAIDYTGNYIYDYIDRKEKLSYGMVSDEVMIEGLALIPTHSFLFGCLVWGGIVAGLFWIYTLAMIWNRFMYAASVLSFYFVNGTIGLVWSILFSPFAAVTRWDSAIYLAAFLTVTAGATKGRIIAADGRRMKIPSFRSGLKILTDKQSTPSRIR